MPRGYGYPFLHSAAVLGRGKQDGKVREWRAIAPRAPEFIAFVGGQTDSWDPLIGLRGKEASQSGCCEIARLYS